MIEKFAGKAPGKGDVLYFSAPWCVPCKSMHVVLDKIKEKVIEVDVDKHPDIAEKYNVHNLPTVMVFGAGGVHLKSATGAMSEEKILAFLE